MCRVEESSSVVGRRNGGDGGGSYGVYPCPQEVVSYIVKKYCLKIGEIAYLKIVSCIIEMMYY
jgi:hypothetical protein